MRPRRQQCGFSLLELVIVIILISILIVIALDRLLILSVEAERVSVLKIGGELRSAMGIKVADLVVKDKGLINVGKLANSNPMDLLAEPPSNYKGEVFDPELQSLEEGFWYFDKKAGELFYVVINDGNLQTDLKGKKRIRFQIQIDYEDRNRNNRFDAGIDSAGGIKLKELDNYKWLRERTATDLLEENR